MTRPTFLTTKGERGRYEGFEIDDLEARYISAYCARFEYQGLPDGCPADYIEFMMYTIGGVSAKKVKGLGPVVMGAAPSAYSTYYYPVRWMPSLIMGGMTGTGVSDSLMEESDMPMLWDRVSMHDRVQPYLEIMRKAVNALNMNLVGLSNPVLVEAAPGLELKGKIIRNNLGSGDVFIPIVDRGATPASVLDLKVSDHTANLLGVIHDMDGEILEMMGIRSALEKASGITTEEASASDQQIWQFTQDELRRREEWLEKLNAKLGTQITVRVADGWEEIAQAPAPEDEEDTTEAEEDAA